MEKLHERTHLSIKKQWFNEEIVCRVQCEASPTNNCSNEELGTLIKETIGGSDVIPHIHKSVISKSSKD